MEKNVTRLIFGVFLLLFGFVGFTAQANAAITLSGPTVSNVATVGTENTSLFEVNLRQVNLIQGTKTYRFDFETKTNAAIPVDHWEVRGWFSEGASLAVNNINLGNSGDVVFFSGSQAPNKFSVILTKEDLKKPTRFWFKVKGFAKDGKFLHSEKEVFFW